MGEGIEVGVGVESGAWETKRLEARKLHGGQDSKALSAMSMILV